jgi:hypothetical protein
MNVTAEDRTKACPTRRHYCIGNPAGNVNGDKRMGEGKVTVQPGLYTFDSVDEEIGFQSVSHTSRRDVPECVERRFHFNNSLRTPAEEGKFFDSERIMGIVADGTALLNRSTEFPCWYYDVCWFGKRNCVGTRRYGFFRGGAGSPCA